MLPLLLSFHPWIASYDVRLLSSSSLLLFLSSGHNTDCLHPLMSCFYYPSGEYLTIIPYVFYSPDDDEKSADDDADHHHVGGDDENYDDRILRWKLKNLVLSSFLFLKDESGIRPETKRGMESEAKQKIIIRGERDDNSDDHEGEDGREKEKFN